MFDQLTVPAPVNSRRQVNMTAPAMRPMTVLTHTSLEVS